jgi:hypothetical protein
MRERERESDHMDVNDTGILSLSLLFVSSKSNYLTDSFSLHFSFWNPPDYAAPIVQRRRHDSEARHVRRGLVRRRLHL